MAKVLVVTSGKGGVEDHYNGGAWCVARAKWAKSRRRRLDVGLRNLDS